MGFRQKVNARNVTQRKFHRTPAASSNLESLTQQVKRNITSKPTRSPHPPQTPVIEPSKPGSAWDEREEQLLLSMHQAGKSSQEMSDQLPGRSQRAREQKLWEMKAQGRAPGLIYSNDWSNREDQILISNRQAGETWEEIGKLLSRTAGAVAKRWNNYLKDDRRRRVNTHKKSQRILWSPREEQLLVSLRAGRKAWDEISKRLPGRSIEACQIRYRYIRHRDGLQEPGYVWTKSEVENLGSLVKRTGKNWSKIAEKFPTRSPEACKLRYNKPFTAQQRRKPWTESEDMTLLSLVIALERNWKKISKEFPSRSQDACRVHYYAYKEQHDGELPEACGPSPEEWRQKWGKESLIYRLRNELSRTTLTTIDVLAAEEAENLAQVGLTAHATNEAVNSDTTEFSYPVLNTVPTLITSRKPRNVDARKRRVMDVPEA